MEAKEIWELDFMIEVALILCESKNKDILEEKIDNLDIKWIQDFTKEFEEVLNWLNNLENKKKLKV